MTKAALLIALAIAPAAWPCAYSAAHYPDWLPQSTADRLIHATAIVVGTATSDRTVLVERVLSGPPQLAGTELAALEVVLTCWYNLPDLKAGQRSLLSVWGKPGDWWVEPVDSGMGERALFHGATTAAKIELAEDVIALRSAPSLLAAMRARAQADTASKAALWALLIDDHARSISRDRPFAELKEIFDSAPRGEDLTRVRALDAMCMADHREAIPLARAVFAAGDDFSLIPAALRCALRFKDHGALSQIVALAPAMNADSQLRAAALEALKPDWKAPWEANDPYYRRLNDDMKSGRAGAWRGPLQAFICLATAEDSKLGLELLEGEERYADRLATRFFSLHPAPEALAIARAKAAGRFGYDHEELTVALAALGDPDVVAWALGPHSPENDDWVDREVLEESPLPAARLTGVAQHQFRAGACGPP